MTHRTLKRGRETRVWPAAVAAVAALTLLGGGIAAGSSQPAASGPDPSRFVQNIDNPWFPLKPGTIFVYEGSKDGKKATDIVEVTNRTRVISGIRCVAVRDTLVLNGKVGEATTDWYAQDRKGNVWYFGERTAEYDARGKVTSREGTWMDGVNGAQAGIYMFGDPRVGRSARQEYYPGHAEDHFTVLTRSASVTVPYGTFNHALKTKEWTPLEPGVRDNKYYVKGLGEIKEVTVKGPLEVQKLVQVIRS
jgi:hypothetical protein